MTSSGTGAAPNADEYLAREAELVKLRREGLTYTQISTRTGIDRSNAHKIVMRALRRDHSEAVDDLRRVEAETLAALQADLMQQLDVIDRAKDEWDRALEALLSTGEKPTLRQPDPELRLKVVDRLLKVMDRRAKLFGLDAPTRLTVTSELDEQIDNLLAELGATTTTTPEDTTA